MTSLRHNGGSGDRGPRSADRGDPRDAYLDAARACILDVGWRRTTLTEVARRAGVSRMTIYRAWSDMPQLLGDLMTREWTALAARAAAQQQPDGAGAVDPVDELVGGVVVAVHALRENELFLRIVELDPELILPYLLARRGRTQDLILARVEEVVRRGQATGRVRVGNPVAISRALLLAAHGFVLSAQTMIDDTVTEADLDAELALALRRVLEP